MFLGQHSDPTDFHTSEDVRCYSHPFTPLYFPPLHLSSYIASLPNLTPSIWWPPSTIPIHCHPLFLLSSPPMSSLVTPNFFSRHPRRKVESRCRDKRFGCRDNRNGCGDKILYFGATVHQLESRGILLSSPLTLGCVLCVLTHLIPLYLCEGRRGAPSLPAQTAPSLPSQTTASISTPVWARWFNEQQECCLRQFLLQQRVYCFSSVGGACPMWCLYRVYIYNVEIAYKLKPHTNSAEATSPIGV